MALRGQTILAQGGGMGFEAFCASLQFEGDPTKTDQLAPGLKLELFLDDESSFPVEVVQMGLNISGEAVAVLRVTAPHPRVAEGSLLSVAPRFVRNSFKRKPSFPIFVNIVSLLGMPASGEAITSADYVEFGIGTLWSPEGPAPGK